MALHLGATNFQIGLLASLPILTNTFQLISVWLVRKYQNRRAISIVTSLIARFALVIIGSGIFSVKMWGRYADRYSNKTIINICAPVYILCILAMAFAAAPAAQVYSVLLLVLINIFSGILTSGINLALNNIGMKLAPQEDATAYTSAKNIIISFFSAIAPLVGGLAANFFTSHSLIWNIEWRSAGASSMLTIINLQGLDLFFIIGGALALFSLRTLTRVKENGEVQKDRGVIYMHGRTGKKSRTRSKKVDSL